MSSSLDAILARHTAAPGQDTKDKLLGASFVVVNRDGVLYTGAAGRIDHDPDSRPWDADCFTQVASLSKLVTAVAAMQLVERGLLALDDDLRGLVPELGAMPILRGFDDDDGGRPILEAHDTPVTLRMLLTHTVGLSYELADPDLMRWHEAVGRTATSLDWSLDGFTTPLKFRPGEGWCYGTAIDWAGQAIERATGRTLGEYLGDNVFAPLGMRDTGFWPERMPPHVADRTAAWSYRDEKEDDDDRSRSLAPGPRPVAREHPVESGGAGLYTTARDYGRFLHALLTAAVVSRETVDEMFRPQLGEALARMQTQLLQSNGAVTVEFAPDMELNHGLSGCINMRDAPGKRRKGSMMWSGMFNSHWWMDRESGIAAVLIVQVQPIADPVVIKLYDELERAVYGELLGQAPA